MVSKSAGGFTAQGSNATPHQLSIAPEQINYIGRYSIAVGHGAVGRP
jgi:hypothetical protein